MKNEILMTEVLLESRRDGGGGVSYFLSGKPTFFHLFSGETVLTFQYFLILNVT